MIICIHFSFRTSKGFGYSCHFMGNCLVLTAVKSKPGRGFTRCIKHELMPRKWHHIAIAHVYSRWGRSDIHCYIDGQLAETIDMSWLVSSNEVCYIADYGYISSGCTHYSISTSATLGVHRMAMRKVAFVVRWAHCMCSPRLSVYSKPTRYTVSDQDIRVIFGTMPNVIYLMDTKRYPDVYIYMYNLLSAPIRWSTQQHTDDGILSEELRSSTVSRIESERQC